MTTNLNVMRVSAAAQPAKTASAQKPDAMPAKTGQSDAFGDTLKEARRTSAKEDTTVTSGETVEKEPAMSESTRQEPKDETQKTGEETAAATDAKSDAETKSDEPKADADDTSMVNAIDAALLRAMQAAPVIQPAAPQTPAVAEAVEANEAIVRPQAESVPNTLQMNGKAQPVLATEIKADANAAAAAVDAAEPKRALSLESLLPNAKDKQGKDLLATLAANNAQLAKYMTGQDAQQTVTAAPVAGTKEASILVGAVGSNAPKVANAHATEQASAQAAQAVAEAVGTTPVTFETTDAESNLADPHQEPTLTTPADGQQQDETAVEEGFATDDQAAARANTANTQPTPTAEPQARVDAMPATHQQSVVQMPSTGAQPVQEAQDAAPLPRADYDIPRQIVDQARFIQRGQDSTMVIKLNPEHLGEITLRVSVTGSGAVNASFHSDNAAVRGIIENTMAQLKQELQAQGLKVENVGVYAGLSDGQLPQSQDQQSLYRQMAQGNGGDNASGNRTGDGEPGVSVAEGAAALEGTTASAAGADASTTDGVDYRV